MFCSTNILKRMKYSTRTNLWVFNPSVWYSKNDGLTSTYARTHARTHGGQRQQRQLVAAVRRKKWHKSLAGSRADESRLGSSTWKGHNQISPRHAQGAATLRSCTLSRPFCLRGGWDLVEGYYRAHPGLSRGFHPVKAHGEYATRGKSPSHPIRPAATEQSRRNVTWRGRDATHCRVPKKRCSSSDLSRDKSKRRMKEQRNRAYVSSPSNEIP